MTHLYSCLQCVSALQMREENVQENLEILSVYLLRIELTVRSPQHTEAWYAALSYEVEKAVGLG